LRGLADAHRWTKESTADALTLFYRAIELDPDFASAYGMAARVYALRRGGGWLTGSDAEVAEVARLARRAAELGKDDAVALGTAGMGLSFIVRDHKHAEALTDRAIALNPNLAWAWLFSGWVKVWLGEPEAAIERVGRALRLSPNDPHSWSMYLAMAEAHLFAGRFEEAASWAQMAVQEKPDFLVSQIVAAACYALDGRREDSERAIMEVRQIDPTLRVSTLRRLFPLRRAEHFVKLAEGLRLAGLPE
jgi:tetratricopeptide (TPR) repeat protein